MATRQQKLASRFARAKARSVRILGLDGRFVRTEDPAVRLNRLIDETLGTESSALRSTRHAPVEISTEDMDENDSLLLEVRAALEFARRAS